MNLSQFRYSIMVACLCSAFNAFATHIVGGEINYKYLGNNTYEIRLLVYRDCFNGVPPLDNPAPVGIFDNANNLVYNRQVPLASSGPITNSITSPCITVPVNVCYEYGLYIDTVTLAPSPGGYHIAYQRCCRNITLVNVVLPNDQGITCYATVADTSSYINSNPVFKSLPPPFICINTYFDFDHSAVDSDGDSLYYELCAPYNGASSGVPDPNPPAAPPYSAVPLAAPYSVQNFLGGVPMSINPFTGQLTAVPNTIGQFVIGVCCKEFRKGVLIGLVKRDFELNVVSCPNITVAAMFNAGLQCGNNTVNFQNASYNASSYYWDFGDPNSTSDFSTLTNPTYNYPSTGTYTVTLIAYSPIDPQCHDTLTKQITLTGPFDVALTFSIDTCNAVVYFHDSVLTGGALANVQYDFGDNSSASGSDPMHTYNNPGTYTVTALFISIDGCIDTVFANVFIPAAPIYVNASASPIAVVIDEPINLTATAPPGVTYNWQPAAIITGNTLAQATALVLTNTTFTVTVTNTIGCTATDTVSVKVTNGGCSEPAIFVPSAFSPNGDGENDILYVRGLSIKSVYWAVYDRWGQKIFESTDLNTGWDGTFKNVALAPAVFDYYVDAFCFNGERFFKKGNVTLLR